MGAKRLKVASLPRRLAAGAIDAVAVLLPVLAVSGAGAWLYISYERRRGRMQDDMPSFRLDRRWGVAIAVVAVPFEVRARNWRGPGYRALGLRRVDAHTGGPVSVRGALIHLAVTNAWSTSTRLLLRPADKRDGQRRNAMDAEVKAARHAHAGDPDAVQQAVTEVYRRHRLNPMRSCLPAVASSVLLRLPALWSPLNQTLPERLAGTVVVED